MGLLLSKTADIAEGRSGQYLDNFQVTEAAPFARSPENAEKL